jgi:hypothetical protein
MIINNLLKKCNSFYKAANLFSKFPLNEIYVVLRTINTGLLKKGKELTISKGSFIKPVEYDSEGNVYWSIFGRFSAEKFTPQENDILNLGSFLLDVSNSINAEFEMSRDQFKIILNNKEISISFENISDDKGIKKPRMIINITDYELQESHQIDNQNEILDALSSTDKFISLCGLNKDNTLLGEVSITPDDDFLNEDVI